MLGEKNKNKGEEQNHVVTKKKKVTTSLSLSSGP